MKKLAIVAAVALAACSNAETAEEPVAVETEAPTSEATMSMAADGQSPVGEYKITLADGSVWTETVNADGTYSSVSPDGETETGTWRQETPERFCSQASDDEAETCRTETIGEDGVWTSVSDSDPADSVTVERVAAS